MPSSEHRWQDCFRIAYIHSAPRQVQIYKSDRLLFWIATGQNEVSWKVRPQLVEPLTPMVATVENPPCTCPPGFSFFRV